MGVMPPGSKIERSGRGWRAPSVGACTAIVCEGRRFAARSARQATQSEVECGGAWRSGCEPGCRLLLDMFVLRGIPFGCGRGRARSDGPARAGGGVTWGVGQVVHRDGASVDSDQHRGATGRPAATSSSRRAAPGSTPSPVSSRRLPTSTRRPSTVAVGSVPGHTAEAGRGQLGEDAARVDADRVLPPAASPRTSTRQARCCSSWPGCSRSRSWQRGCFAGGPQPLAEASGMTGPATCDGSGPRRLGRFGGSLVTGQHMWLGFHPAYPWCIPGLWVPSNPMLWAQSRTCCPKSAPDPAAAATAGDANASAAVAATTPAALISNVDMWNPVSVGADSAAERSLAHSRGCQSGTFDLQVRHCAETRVPPPRRRGA